MSEPSRKDEEIMIIEVFDTTSKLLFKGLTDIRTETCMIDLKKSEILYSAGILQNILEISGDLSLQDNVPTNTAWKKINKSNKKIIKYQTKQTKTHLQC